MSSFAEPEASKFERNDTSTFVCIFVCYPALVVFVMYVRGQSSCALRCVVHPQKFYEETPWRSSRISQKSSSICSLVCSGIILRYGL